MLLGMLIRAEKMRSDCCDRLVDFYIFSARAKVFQPIRCSFFVLVGR